MKDPLSTNAVNDPGGHFVSTSKNINHLVLWYHLSSHLSILSVHQRISVMLPFSVIIVNSVILSSSCSPVGSTVNREDLAGHHWQQKEGNLEHFEAVQFLIWKTSQLYNLFWEDFTVVQFLFWKTTQVVI